MPTATASDGLRKVTGCAVVGNRARVRRMNPAEDLHHRALAGAVLAEESVNLSRLARELRAVQRDDAAEPLVDASGAEEGHDRLKSPGRDEQVTHLSLQVKPVTRTMHCSARRKRRPTYRARCVIRGQTSS